MREATAAYVDMYCSCTEVKNYGNFLSFLSTIHSGWHKSTVVFVAGVNSKGLTTVTKRPCHLHDPHVTLHLTVATENSSVKFTIHTVT